MKGRGHIIVYIKCCDTNVMYNISHEVNQPNQTNYSEVRKEYLWMPF